MRRQRSIKIGWLWLAVLALLVVNTVQWFAIRELQESRNRINTYIHHSEIIFAKQNTFNREYYFKTRDFKRAEKDWPIYYDKETGTWN
jgi:hypothetical protein